MVPDTLHFYGREPPGISVGYFKKIEEDLYLDRCKERGVVVVRRTSGGGTIFTDKGQLIYGLITEKHIGDGIEGSFRVMCKIIIDALSRFGISAVYKAPNDIVVNGKKVSGNAQTVRDKAVLMHGTIIMDLDTQLMSYVLKERKPGYVSSLRQECGHAPTLDEMKAALADSFKKSIGEELETSSLTDFEISEIERLIRERYGCDEWNLKR